MTTFKPLTALIFLVAHITVTCMEKDPHNTKMTAADIQQKQHLGYCYIMISPTQSNAASLKTFRSNKQPLQLTVDLVNPKTNAIVLTEQVPVDLIADLSFGDSFEGEGETGVTATFIYVKNPRLKGATLSEQLEEAKKIAFADLCAKRLKQIKY
jgi:hypothetical protein